MKVVHICLNGEVTDGWNYQDNILPKYHKKLGFDVTVITSQWVYDNYGNTVRLNKSNYFNEFGVKMIRLENLFGTVRSKFKKFKKLYETIEREKPDYVFMHDFQCLDSMVVAKYLKEHTNVKGYVDNHADFSNSATNFISKWILHRVVWKYCAKRLNKYVLKFYGVFPARVDFLVEQYGLPKDKCELLLMGADDEYVIKAKSDGQIEVLKEKYGITDNDFVVVTGGKIDRWKSQTVQLLEAVRQISGRKIKMILFGSIDNELKKDVLEYIDNKHIFYAGWLNSVQSYYYFEMADIAVFPGRHSVFWEQVVGQGIPIMCKRWEGTTHIDLGGNAIILEEESATLIKNELLKLMDDSKKLRNMKKIAAEKGEKYFLYSRIAKQSLEL